LWIKQASQRLSLVLQVVKYHKNDTWQSFLKINTPNTLHCSSQNGMMNRLLMLILLTTEVKWLAFIQIGKVA
jgi:hypothetical protein